MAQDEGLARVRAIMQAGVEVDMPPDLVPPGFGAGGGALAGEDPGRDPGEEFGRDHAPPPPPPPADPGAPAPPEAGCADLPLNDLGNGQRLVAHFGRDLLFVPRVGWHVWDGRRWALDPDEIEVRRVAHRLPALIEREVWHLPLPPETEATLAAGAAAEEVLNTLGVVAPREQTEEQKRELAAARRTVEAAREAAEARDKTVARRLTHARNAGNTNAIKNLLTEAGAILARPLDTLDACPLTINTEGGVVRVAVEPGEDDGGQAPPRPRVRIDVLPHDRGLWLTKMLPVAADPRATCPRFEAFLRRVQPVREMREFLQRWFGYSLTGLTGEQKFAFLYGSGANGKSVLLDLLARIAGGYAATARIESITGQNRRGGGDATPDLVPLIGARMVRAAEPEEGRRLQEGLIKDLTGGEPIMVRALHSDFVLVYPKFKLTVSGNHKPEIHGGDDGIWRRVLLVPFDVQIPPEERDPKLVEKLWEERDGIFNWLLAGLRSYLEGGLRVPGEVTSATEEYREDSDPIGAFLGYCCEVTGNADDVIEASVLGAAFNYWFQGNGMGAWQPQTVAKRLKARSRVYRSPVTGQAFTAVKRSRSVYAGIRIVEPFRSDFNNAPRAQDGTVLARFDRA